MRLPIKLPVTSVTKPVVFLLALGMLSLSGAAQAQTIPQTLPTTEDATENSDDKTPVILVGTGLGARAPVGLTIAVGVLVVVSGGDGGGATTTTGGS